MKTYYLYDKQNFYTENPIILDEGAEAPARSTVYEPRTSPGLRPWWSGDGWIPVHDLRKLSLHQKKTILTTLCTAIRPPAPDPKYSLAEIESWPYQLQEAKDFGATGEAGPILQALAKAQGVAPKEIVAQVLAAHQKRMAALAEANVAVQALRNQIAAAATDDDLPKHSRILKLVYG